MTSKDQHILTERLLLRPFETGDLDIIYKLYSDPDIIRFTPKALMDRHAAQAHLDTILAWWKQEPVLEREMAVVLRDTEQSIGRCHISVDREHDTGMIGCFLLGSYWGKGYGSEVVEGLISHCFNGLRLHRVNGLCNPDNTASRRMMEKAGMRLEGHFKKKCRYLWEGQTAWHDELEYAILDEEYRWEGLKRKEHCH